MRHFQGGPCPAGWIFRARPRPREKISPEAVTERELPVYLPGSTSPAVSGRKVVSRRRRRVHGSRRNIARVPDLNHVHPSPQLHLPIAFHFRSIHRRRLFLLLEIDSRSGVCEPGAASFSCDATPGAINQSGKPGASMAVKRSGRAMSCLRMKRSSSAINRSPSLPSRSAPRRLRAQSAWSCHVPRLLGSRLGDLSGFLLMALGETSSGRGPRHRRRRQTDVRIFVSRFHQGLCRAHPCPEPSRAPAGKSHRERLTKPEPRVYLFVGWLPGSTAGTGSIPPPRSELGLFRAPPDPGSE